MKNVESVEDLEVGDIYKDSDEDYLKITEITDENIHFEYNDTVEELEDPDIDNDIDYYEKDRMNRLITVGEITLIKAKNNIINWRRRIENEKTKEGEGTNQEA